ncbi:hypothetical protein K8R42_05030, partial [bacterium]|nr:hypothetical protein [bacterium]
CTDCHKGWETGEFDHAVTGLLLNEEHVDFDCDACHENRNFARTPVCEMCHDEDISWPKELPGERK